MRLAVLVLLSGCSLFGVGRGSVGVTGSTDGSVGVAASFELGGGWIEGPIDEDRSRMAESLTVFMGGAGTTHGAELEAGARVDYLRIRGRRLLRAGVREALIERHDDTLMSFDAAFSIAWPGPWNPTRARYAGVELRAGPAFRVIDTADDDNLRWHALRIYAGVVLDYVAVDGDRYDPIKAILEAVRRTN